MGFLRLPGRVFDVSPLIWRSLLGAALLIGLSLSSGQPPTTVAVNPNASSLAQQPEPATNDTSTASEPNSSEQELRIKQRLLTVALVGGVLLLLLAFGYGYLRLELTTRGFYSGRLQIAAGIASVSVIAAAYFLWRWLIN